ncbi:thioredoxin family protein [Candidatus Dojkabacteria bacterium]|uniref:Thioredoxin family protein n=1 Tax=Candidatus Dojkabacteria bacterium TaxID=2099670 RepID=A0A955RK84_9BACT|nr:thioredoxin family protein [Candidatus Dojkabacteria bacterium]
MITFYGANWCGDCIRSKALLDNNEITYEYVDIEKNPEAVAYVEKINNGLRSIPTIVFDNGEVLTEPSNEQLLAMIKDIT